jgi:hypothetical protein
MNGSLAECSERRSDLVGEDCRLFPSCEVAAIAGFVEVGEVVVTAFSPAPRRTVNFAREYCHGHREVLDINGIEVVRMIFPVDLRG